ncbi:hypothetical protein [Hymenobacter tenuis]
MLFYPLPRRHHRHLLLPPGLVALAWLLLLGCLALPSIIPRQAVMEIRLFNPKGPQGCLVGFPTPQQIDKWGPWQNITVSSNEWAGYFDMRMVESVCLFIKEDIPEQRALRVYFDESTSYNTLIQLLDIPIRMGIHKHWLDLRRPPFTFNLLGNDPPIPPHYSFICGTTSTS